MKAFDYQWINSDTALTRLCEQLSQEPAIALDTEFIRSRTYYPHLGLLQIADSRGIYLVDPLKITQSKPLTQLLTNSSIVKVIHACSEDLDVFQSTLGVLPASLFDTQIAAGFAGYGVSISYANLLRDIKGIDIPKQETRSNWLQRPLSDSQLNYATLDVAYLLDIYQILVEQLQQQKRIEWVESDCDAMVDKLRNTNHKESYYLRIKKAWKLKSHQLAVLQALCAWREQQAQTRNVPRSRVLKDSSLFDLARRLPNSMQQLKRIQDIQTRCIEASGQCLLTTIAEVLNTEVNDTSSYPAHLPKPLNAEQITILKQLKQRVSHIAATLNVPQELLIRKKDYEELIRSKEGSSEEKSEGHYHLPSSLTDWRQDIIGTALLDYLHTLKPSIDT
ncbi:ribonuclease D [Candidatus Endobugula sertula]|uniref:Ribonuclease D n=1 Tax=Candidatus Endobugula sertula TaxID=62101 RepID=A0A1D2QQ53_9GAMM|nr:ribonuclease D [Candidatus Endobugula sertula]